MKEVFRTSQAQDGKQLLTQGEAKMKLSELISTLEEIRMDLDGHDPEVKLEIDEESSLGIKNVFYDLVEDHVVIDDV
jgi:hypothetical protein